MSTARRAEWVDCARALAMFFIVWLHANAAPDGVGKVVGGAIALFFLLAGYFLPSSAGRVMARTGRLALAWGLWSLLSVLFLLVVKPYVDISWQRVVLPPPEGPTMAMVSPGFTSRLTSCSTSRSPS